jgi:hypothetical protein
MTIYKGIRIVDKNLRDGTVSNILNIGENYTNLILERLSSWAKNSGVNTISVVKLTKKNMFSNIEGIVNIDLGKGNILRIGIWKVYGNVSGIPSFIGNF